MTDTIKLSILYPNYLAFKNKLNQIPLGKGKFAEQLELQAKTYGYNIRLDKDKNKWINGIQFRFMDNSCSL